MEKQASELEEPALYRGEFSTRVLRSTDAEARAWDLETTRTGVSDSIRLDWPPDARERDAHIFQGAPS